MTADTQPAETADKPDYDSPWKEALERFFPEFLDKELQQIGGNSTRGRRYADKLVRVRAKDGSDLYVLIHVEIQGDADSDFRARMFLYHTRLRDCHSIDVVSLAVLTDTTARFRPTTFRHARWGCGIAFRFPMVKLLDFTTPERWAELEASDNVFALVVMAQIKAKVTDDAQTLKRWKFRLIRLMYDRDYERALIEELLRLIDWMIRLPAALEAEFRQELYAYEEQRQMPYVTTFEQAGIKKGEARTILRLLDQKFGPEVVQAHRERIETAELEQLDAWLDRVLTAETPETIFH
jgi:hypothetical protein